MLLFTKPNEHAAKHVWKKSHTKQKITKSLQTLKIHSSQGRCYVAKWRTKASTRFVSFQSATRETLRVQKLQNETKQTNACEELLKKKQFLAIKI